GARPPRGKPWANAVPSITGMSLSSRMRSGGSRVAGVPKERLHEHADVGFIIDHEREARSPRLARLRSRCKLSRFCSVDRFLRPEVSRGEGDLHLDLPDLLVHHERAMARVVAIFLELLAELEEALA